jgi:hypothetical protein
MLILYDNFISCPTSWIGIPGCLISDETVLSVIFLIEKPSRAGNAWAAVDRSVLRGQLEGSLERAGETYNN